MSLRSALLALITAGPMTGYDAAKRFAGSVGNIWYASDSQIYPELRKMEADGLLSTRPVPWGSKGTTKTEYTVTEDGKAALGDWVASPLTYTLERDPARLRTAYLEWTDPATARQHFQEHIEHHSRVLQMAEEQIEEITRRTHPTLRRRLETYDDAEARRVVEFKLMAYRGVCARSQAEIDWAEECLGTLQAL